MEQEEMMLADLATGTLIYDASLTTVEQREYGAALAAVGAGEQAPPPEGLRVDVVVEGPCTGVLSGTVSAIDYLTVRADGRSDLHIHGYLRLEDGAMISVAAVGVARRNRGGFIEYVTLHCSDERYRWVNTAPIRAEGAIDMASGTLSIQGYLA